MENREYTKRKKEADEIFCSECGEIIKQKAEICPMCGVRQHGTPQNDEKSLASKFWTTASVSFLVLLSTVIFTQPSHAWLNGVVGALALSLIPGLIAMALPTYKKIIYIPVSLFIILFITAGIGLYAQKQARSYIINEKINN